MSIYYNGDHSITFWNVGEQYTTGNPFNTWEDFHLIPLSRPYVVEPEANIHIIPIVGTNKRIDITDKLPGRLTFGKRSGQWEFAIDYSKYDDWTESFDYLVNFFHGKKMMVSLNDDPAKIYYGFITVTGYNPGSDYTTVTLQYDLDKGYYDFTDVEAPIIPSSRFPTDIDLLQRVRFYGLNNSLLDESYYRIGVFPNIPSIPDEDNYDFIYWDPAIHFVNGNIDYHAVYEYIPDSSGGGGGGGGGTSKVNYRFMYGNNVISHGTISKGRIPPPPSHDQLPVVEGRFFDSWNPNVGKIYNDTDYVAVYLSYPTEIKIVTKPTKIDYEDGETIDYSGMVVKAYTSDGELYTDRTHPDGIIPISELTLPVKLADYSAATHGTKVITEFDIDPNPFDIGSLDRVSAWSVGHGAYRRDEVRYSDGVDGVIGSRKRLSSTVVDYYIASSEPFTVTRYSKTYEVSKEEAAGLTNEQIARSSLGVLIQENTSTIENNAHYTYNGKTVYYYTGTGYYGAPTYWDIEPIIVGNAGQIAWSMVYGEIIESGSQSIPVQYVVPKNESVLSTEFHIKVERLTVIDNNTEQS